MYCSKKDEEDVVREINDTLLCIRIVALIACYTNEVANVHYIRLCG